MSFVDYVKKENQQSRREMSQLSKVAVLMLIAGVLSGLILTGCGRTLKASTKAVFNVTRAVTLDGGEAVYRTGQQMGSGRGAVGSEGYEMPQGDLPPIDMGTVDAYEGW